jgi:hypothetical protein
LNSPGAFSTVAQNMFNLLNKAINYYYKDYTKVSIFMVLARNHDNIAGKYTNSSKQKQAATLITNICGTQNCVMGIRTEIEKIKI